jgi:hypothetical protein
MGRPRKRALGSAEPTEPDSSPATPDAVAYQCGVYGLNPFETEAKLTTSLSDRKLLDAYQAGKAEHAFGIMQKIYEGAMNGKEKLLIWLAENSLKRNVEATTGNALIDAMTPEQRRERIKELTKQLSLA